MKHGAKLTGSEIGYHLAVSPLAFGAAGSSDPVDMSEYEFATLLVGAGSVNTGFEAHVLRSSASDGTFNGFGASVGVSEGGKALVRSFALDSSQTHYRIYYTNGTGSAIAAVFLIGQGARQSPLPTQPTNTTVFSTVLNA